MSLDPEWRERLLAALAESGSTLDRAAEVWESLVGTRKGLADALTELERDGVIVLNAYGEGAEREIFGVRSVASGERPPSTVELVAQLPVERDSRRVFVVYGRDRELRASMFAFLRAINLWPLEWSELVSSFGIGSPYIGELLDHAFDLCQAAVVLFTPDEQVALASHVGSHDREGGLQPRPNVIFEAGLALGRFPDRTVIVEIGSLRGISDLGGRQVTRLDDRTADSRAEMRHAFAEHLRAVGCDVQTTGTDWLHVGDFVPPA
jgi:predicted nucleotide-binding protein